MKCFCHLRLQSIQLLENLVLGLTQSLLLLGSNQVADTGHNGNVNELKNLKVAKNSENCDL